MRIVFDTNVIVSALRSNKGASFQLVSRFRKLPIDICISVALVLEYEAVLKRDGLVPLTEMQVDIFLDILCNNTLHPKITYLWRPFLKDAKDDLVLELALNAGAIIVTHNVKDFEGSESLGVKVLTPAQLIDLLVKKG